MKNNPLIISYCDWGQADEKIIDAVKNGSNVIIWFSINLLSINNKPFIQDTRFDFNKVKFIKKKINELYPENKVIHLMSIGGWNSPHISTDFDSITWFNELHKWNISVLNNLDMQNDYNELGFDGFDFDLEGNDDLQSEYNHFTIKQLDLIGTLAQELKKNSYLIGIAPSQSYINCVDNEFDLNLNFDPFWLRNKSNNKENSNFISKEDQPKQKHEELMIKSKAKLPDSFPYHGKNVFTYVFKKYYYIEKEEIEQNDLSTTSKTRLETFDFISIQLYEGWSEANYEIFFNNVKAETYILNLIKTMKEGWEVKFSMVPETNLQDQKFCLDNTNLVIGLANGWAGECSGFKFLLLYKQQLKNIVSVLREKDLMVKGFMFWSLKHEGDKVVDPYNDSGVKWKLEDQKKNEDCCCSEGNDCKKDDHNKTEEYIDIINRNSTVDYYLVRILKEIIG